MRLDRCRSFVFFCALAPTLVATLVATVATLVAALVVTASPLQALSKAPPKSPFASNYQANQIGVRTLKYFDAKRSRPIVVELWYPTDQPIDETLQGEESVWIHPLEVRNSPLSELSLKYPLIVMSHGHRGDRRERSWLAEHLAKNGFAVAAVEHHGNTFANYNPLISIRFWERPLDISFAIDQLLTDSFLQNRIDAKHIGFVGYSMGGMTGLALAGAVADNVKEIILREQARNKEVTSEMIEQIDFSGSRKNYNEPRIKAMLLICPATFVYPTDTLQKIKVPTALVAAVEDEILPHKDHALRIIRHLKAVKMQMMNQNVTHYTFLNRVSDLGKKIFHKRSVNDPPGCDRLSIHHKVGVFAVQFFKEQFY